MTDIFTNSFKLLALDLDGTLLTNEKRLTERTRRALLAAHGAGMQIALVTGRPFAGLPSELLQIPQIGYAITSNGAVSTALSDSRKLRTELMPVETILQILDYPMRSGLIYNVFLDGMGYCDQTTFQRLLAFFGGTVLEDYVLASRRGFDDLEDLLEQHPEGAENIWIMANDPGERNDLAARARDTWHLHTVFTAATDLEITDPAADKGIALTELASNLGIAREEILAFGDNENDLGMFLHAGASVAMGNASEYVRSQADLVTDTNERDGVARVLEQLLG